MIKGYWDSTIVEILWLKAKTAEPTSVNGILQDLSSLL